mgnify:FL=1
MYADYHLHSEFSDDSKELMERQVEKAIKLGLDEMCFTDHVDYGIKRDWDAPRGIEWRQGDGISSGDAAREPLANVDYPRYFAKIACIRAAYGDAIKIRSGLEFGIQSITVNDYERLFAKYQDELDFVLFSMHQVDNKEFWTQDFQRGRSQKEYNEAYYEEIFKTMKAFKHYSVLAHLDLLVRYDKAGRCPFENVRDLVAEILKQAIADGKGIEVNTSSWHYGLSDTQPSRDILHLYKNLGGRIITVGSDAHQTSYLADHIKDAYAILRDEIGFTEIATFEHMQPIFHKLR